MPEMRKYRILPDISHASDALFYDTASLYDGPLVASHSDARAVCAHPRNLTDEQAREIICRGGLIGLNLCPFFLRADADSAVLSDMLRHAEHFLSLGGEKTLCIGGDFDGTDLPCDVYGVEAMEVLAELFLRHGYAETLVENIFYGNARAFGIFL